MKEEQWIQIDEKGNWAVGGKCRAKDFKAQFKKLVKYIKGE
jgi:hypothetical protein